jgi:hypothetical protein
MKSLRERGDGPQRKCEFIITVLADDIFVSLPLSYILTVAILDTG